MKKILDILYYRKNLLENKIQEHIEIDTFEDSEKGRIENAVNDSTISLLTKCKQDLDSDIQRIIDA